MVKECLSFFKRDIRNGAQAFGYKEGDLFKCEPYLQMRTAFGSHVMWVPCMLDILGEDWEEV